eukprot:7169145-Prymnesium_polylepis.1
MHHMSLYMIYSPRKRVSARQGVSPSSTAAPKDTKRKGPFTLQVQLHGYGLRPRSQYNWVGSHSFGWRAEVRYIQAAPRSMQSQRKSPVRGAPCI